MTYARLLIASSWSAPFVLNDARVLREAFKVQLLTLNPRHFVVRMPLLMRGIWRSDLSIFWFGEVHAALGTLLCRILGKPSLVCLAGFETAAMQTMHYGARLGAVSRFVVWIAIRCADKVVVPSRFLADEVVRFHPGAVVSVAPNAVDTEQFRPNPSVQREGVVTVVAHDPLVKGLDILLAAANELPDLSFSVIGVSQEDLDAWNLQPPRNVAVLGARNHAEMPRLYQQAVVVCQPSRREAFGMAVAEGMSCGCIPVVMNCGGLPEVVADQGVLVPNEEPGALVESIRRAYADRKRFAPRDRARSLFSLEARRVRIMGLVQDLLKNRC